MIGKETNTKKQRPNWDDYYLNIAKAISERATCMRRRYGAVIVDTSNAIVSSGYNGSPVGAVNCIDRGICKRKEMHIPKGERYELCEAIHAEQNAIINCTKQRMIGATIYIYGENVADGTIASGEPCLLCARMIKNAGITRVVASTPIGDKKADCAPKPFVDKVSFHDQNGNSKVIDVSDINKSEKPDLNKKPKVIKAECAFAHGKKAKRKSLKRFSTYMSENAHSQTKFSEKLAETHGDAVDTREQDIPALIQRLKNVYGSKGVKMNKTIFGEVYSFENQQIEIIFNRIKDSTARSVDQALDQLGIMDPKIKKLFDNDNMIKCRFELKTSDEFGKRIGLCVNLDRRMRDDIIHKLYTRYGNIGCRRIVDAKGFARDVYELEASDGVILSVIFEAHDPECLYGQPNTVENIDQEVDKLVKTFTDDLHTTSLE